VRLAVLDRPLLAIWRGTEAEGTRTRTPKPSGFSWSPVSGSLPSGEWRKKPLRRARGSRATIFSPPSDCSS